MGHAEERALEEKRNPVERTFVHRGQRLEVLIDRIRSGPKTHAWEIVLHPGAVAILPIDAQGNLILVRQWRRAAEQILIELPAGTLEQGEAPLVCAKREIQEETGFAAEHWHPCGGMFSAPGFCNEYIHFFIATGLKPSPLPADDDEAIDVVKMDLDTAMQAIKNNMICDAKTIAGILRYAAWREGSS